MTSIRWRPVAALAGALAFGTPALLDAQAILVAPTTVFMDATARTASLLLVNPNPDPVEVDLSAFFGYMVTDSTGRLALHTDEHPDSTEPSAAAWLRVFPRRATIAPNGQQTVRLLLLPPPGLPDGEYWARLAILARGAKLPLTTTADSGTVQVGLAVEVRTILPVLVRKGKVVTGAVVSAVHAERRGDSLVVEPALARTGNAALLGTLRLEVADTTGAVRRSYVTPISIYRPLAPRYGFALDSLPPGRYSVRVELAPGRTDLPPDALLPFHAVRDSTVIRLP